MNRITKQGKIFTQLVNNYWLRRYAAILFLWTGLSLISQAQTVFKVPSQYPNIQAAIDAAWDGDTVLIADGVYNGEGNNSIRYFGKRITIKSENGPGKCTVAATFYFTGYEDTLSVLSGITISGSNAIEIGTGSSPFVHNCNIVSSATHEGKSAVQTSGGGFFADCKFIHNQSSSKYSYGGAIGKSGNSPLYILNCQFIENEAGKGAGAIDGSNIIIYNCYFELNKCRYSVGCAIAGVNLYIENSRFYKNGGGSRGATGAISGSNIILKNCIFDGNLGIDPDGSFSGSNILTVSNAQISNTIFVNNESDYPTVSSGNSINNCTFYYNKSLNDAVIVGCNVKNSILYRNLPQEASNSTIIYSQVRRGYTGTGNIDTDPLFVNPDSLDFRLQPNSPCIDAGDPSSPKDPDGTRADMGAIPYFQENPNLSSVSLSEKNTVRVFPNPTSSSITILSPEPIKQIKILTADGKVVHVMKPDNKDKNTLDLKKLKFPKGIYLINIQTHKLSHVQRVVFN